MKGRWEFIINVWFPSMYSQKWNCYFQNIIIMFCLPVPTLIYLWEIHIFPDWSGIYKSLTDTWMWKLELSPHNSQKRNTVYLGLPKAEEGGDETQEGAAQVCVLVHKSKEVSRVTLHQRLACTNINTLIKNYIKFSSYVRKFRMEQLQSHKGRAS